MNNDQIIKKYKEIEDGIINDIENTTVPNTLKSLVRFSKKLDTIMDSLELIKDQYYCSQILVRSLFEHFIVAHYIYIKWYLEKNDKTGSEYYREYMASEFLKQTSYNYQIDSIEAKANKTISLEDYRKIKGMEESTQVDINQLHMIGNQFDIRKIGKYLMTVNIESKGLIGVHKGILDFMRRYNKLSSWVHGGPHSEIISFENSTHEMKEICEENVRWAKSASRSIKFNIITIICGETNGKYFDVMEEMVNKKGAD